MKYQIAVSSRFKRDFKNAKRRGYDISILKEVVDILAKGAELPEKYRDHSLSGEYANCRECHIQPDWLLIYRIERDMLILGLIRTGSHNDLF